MSNPSLFQPLLLDHFTALQEERYELTFTAAQ
jgi:hypothetical protein